MKCKPASPRIPVVCDTVLEALQHSLSASRLSHMAQIHAHEENCESFKNMAEATDKMIDALDSLHASLQSLALAVLPRDIDLSGNHSNASEPAWEIANGFKSTSSRHYR